MKENKSVSLKGNGGITLIALVITIIVLLILAGVSIAMISGQNGILGQASKSADYNAIGEARDNIANKVNEYVASYYESVYAGGTYIGTAGVDSVVAAINDALKACVATTPVKVEYTVATTSTDGTVTITSGAYSQEGTVDKDSGAVDWGNIQ